MNTTSDIRSKGSLHGHLLLALLPVPSFIHKKSRVCSLLSDRLLHHCLDLVLTPLKIAATIGVMMNDPHGNLRYCFTPLIGYITDMLEQSLLSCTSPRVSPMSTATYKEFGNDRRHDPRTTEYTLNTINVLCAEANPNNFSAFLKATQSYGLNSVYEPFWRNWLLSDANWFLKIEPLHHFFKMAWDHDIQWCIMVVGEDEINYCFNLLQTPVGYCSFVDGISKLKQVTGHNHRSIQRYILCTVAGAVPLRFLAAIHALLDFCYLAQMPVFDEHILAKLDAALASFHTHKHAILAAGACSEHFRIPKLELMHHVVPSIHASGAPMQWSADVTEHAHVTEIKNPACAGNNQNYYAQIAHHLDCSDKCFRFDLVTGIASSHDSHLDCIDDPADKDHEPDNEESHTLFYHSPTITTVTFYNPHQCIPESSASFPSPHAQSRNLTLIPDSEHLFLITLDHS